MTERETEMAQHCGVIRCKCMQGKVIGRADVLGGSDEPLEAAAPFRCEDRMEGYVYEP
jgi:hypothetical protein